MFIFSQKLKCLKIMLKGWNHHKVGTIFHSKENITTNLCVEEAKLQLFWLDETMKHYSILTNKLNSILAREAAKTERRISEG
jgi:hypothetical protein